MSNVEVNNSKHRDGTIECSCLSNCSHFVQHGLETVFGNIGRIVGRYPWWTIICSLISVGLFGFGFLNWTTESRTNKLWVRLRIL